MRSPLPEHFIQTFCPFNLLIAHARIPNAFARHPVLLRQLFLTSIAYARIPSAFARHPVLLLQLLLTSILLSIL